MPSTTQRGFTLIEIMVVVAIVAVVASIALPQYSEYTRRSKRASAIADLKAAQLQLEKWRVDHSSYAGASEPVDTAYYNYSLTGTSATGYTLSAAALGDQAKDACGDLSIVKAGAVVTNKASTGKTTCW